MSPILVRSMAAPHCHMSIIIRYMGVTIVCSSIECVCCSFVCISSMVTGWILCELKNVVCRERLIVYGGRKRERDECAAEYGPHRQRNSRHSIECTTYCVFYGLHNPSIHCAIYGLCLCSPLLNQQAQKDHPTTYSKQHEQEYCN